MNRKLLEIIALLTKEEIRRFRLFLASPYFVKGTQCEILVALFDYLCRYAASPTHARLQKQVVAEIVLKAPELTPTTSKRLDKLGTELLDLTEHFLWLENKGHGQRSIAPALNMMHFWGKHHVEKRFWQATDYARKLLAAYPHNDRHYYQQAFEFYYEITRYSTQFSSLKKELGTTEALLAFDEYNTQTRLELAIIQQNQAKLFNAPIEHSPIQKIWLSYLEAHPDSVAAVSQVMLKSLALIRAESNTQTEIQTLEAAIVAQQAALPGDMFMLLLTNARNMMIRFWNQKQEPEVLHWLFERLSDHLEKGWISENGKLSTNALRTCLVLALKVGNTTWARQLLHDYPPENITGTKYPEEFYQLNWSYFYFKTGDYEKAEQSLKQVNFEYQLFNLLAEVQLILIYYESDNPLLEFRLKALEQKVRRSAQTPAWKKRVNRFVYFTSKLEAFKWQHTAGQLADMVTALRDENDVLEKQWLLDAFDRISQNKKGAR